MEHMYIKEEESDESPVEDSDGSNYVKGRGSTL